MEQNKYALIFFFFMMIAQAFGQQSNTTIEGLVLNQNGKELTENSQIIFHRNPTLKHTFEGGKFYIELPFSGKVQIEIRHQGYRHFKQEIDLVDGQKNGFTFVLEERSQDIDEMLVEAQVKKETTSPTLRIETPLIELPQNVQVVDKETLEEQQIFDMLEGVQRNVSGATKLEHWDNYVRINMRGSQITPFRNGMNTQLSPWSPLPEDMSTVERIEFVKGPASFMLGNADPAGFMNVVTKTPSGKNQQSIQLSTGSFQLTRAALDLDGTIDAAKKWKYRFNTMGQTKGSHRLYEFNNRYLIAPVVSYEIEPGTELLFEYVLQDVTTNAIGGNYAFSNRGLNDLDNNFTTLEPNLAPTKMTDQNLRLLFIHQLTEQWKLTAQIGYLHFNQVGQSLWPTTFVSGNDSLLQRRISIWDAMGTNRNAQFFLNGNFKTGFITHRLLAGVDMSYRKYWADWSQGGLLGDTTFNIYDPQYGRVNATTIPQWDRSQDIRERGVYYGNGYTSAYLQDELAFFENKVRLTLAARYTNMIAENPYSGTYTTDKLTPRAGLSWSILPNLSIYGVYDEAFLANPGLDYQGNNFDPITGNNLELGLKKDWFKGKWHTTASVFQLTKNNLLTTDIEHPDPTTGQFMYSRQTGQQQFKGIEFDARGQITKGLSLTLNYAYTDGRITKDSDTSLVNAPTPGTTKHVQNTWIHYQVQKGFLKGLRLNAGYQYQAGRSTWFASKTANPLPDYTRFDGGIGYNFNKLTVDLVVNNLANASLYSGAPYYGMYYWQTEAGRNYRLTLRYNF